jgi:succinate-acetate transporter protein
MYQQQTLMVSVHVPVVMVISVIQYTKALQSPHHVLNLTVLLLARQNLKMHAVVFIPLSARLAKRQIQQPRRLQQLLQQLMVSVPATVVMVISVIQYTKALQSPHHVLNLTVLRLARQNLKKHAVVFIPPSARLAKRKVHI